VWILARLSSTTQEVTTSIEEYRFGDALRTPHAFVWDDFADWYIEASKVAGMTTPEVGTQVFRTVLQLLHPFMPFVTETLWDEKHFKDWLIVSKWPEPSLGSAQRAARSVDVRSAQHLVRIIRSTRALLDIPAARKVRVQVGGNAAAVDLWPAVEFLAGCSITGEDRSTGWVSLPGLGSIRVRLDQAALKGVDISARLVAVEKRAAEARVQVERLEKQLGAMRGKAPEESIADVTSRLDKARVQLHEHEQSLSLLRDVGAH
jgi:valyl-tRNA synthetase